MKFAQKVILLTAAASIASAAPAPAQVTVTQGVTVRAIVYVKDGQTQTDLTTLGQNAAPTTVAAAAAAVTTTAAPASAKVAVQAAAAIQEDVVLSGAASQQQAATVTLAPAAVSTTSTPVAAAAAATTTTPAAAAATTAAAAASSDDSNLSEFASSVLNEHNAKRALHQNTPALSWSDDLASYAQNYADAYDCSGNLVHSGGPYGENLALGYDAVGSVDAWYNEISSYDYSNPGFSENAGHFTQVVWKSSTQVGCGIKDCSATGWGSYVICSYNPAGNFIGEFAENVEPLA
ncbi:hypothetical protein NCAS_0B07620 [Naumovozyma castellii]|uniref:SCP domain-containing protein n=1 Tax=Naumovozyma castellii TaxID=27288 RepID=G0VAB6_NAUCA|nr:hypothetical protein NCAS_0B07620 [Naumovozyma castellii CBS 4309]CCC68846.1 hypothetical protein NCAS_0B07620 [Naumovozyma castellii CBS 4309]